MRLNSWIMGAAAVMALAGCGPKGPLLHQMEPDVLYERGMREFEEEKWTEAIRTLEQLVARNPTHPRIQEVRYRIGDAYFGKKEYVTAAGEFVRLATDFPSGEYSDDARFKACEAYYHLSPKPQLDQEYTRAAIDHCQSLATYFPSSEFTPRAQALVDDLKEKLANKIFLNGEYYYRRKAYDSSIIYFEDVLRQYPESTFAPRALLRLVQVYYALGYREEMDAAKDRLAREYPGTAEAQQAQGISLAGGR